MTVKIGIQRKRSGDKSRKKFEELSNIRKKNKIKTKFRIFGGLYLLIYSDLRECHEVKSGEVQVEY